MPFTYTLHMQLCKFRMLLNRGSQRSQTVPGTVSKTDFFPSASGCADLREPRDSWLDRDGDEVVVGCKETRQTWHLKCRNNQWHGVIGNCTQRECCSFEKKKDPVREKLQTLVCAVCRSRNLNRGEKCRQQACARQHLVLYAMGFAVRVRSAGQKYGPTCHQSDRADVTEFVTLVRSSLGQHVGVLALAGYKRRKSALTAGPIG